MKKSDIMTLEDLKEFLTEYSKENPEDDCCELVRSICEEHDWICTDDSDIEYHDGEYAIDGSTMLAYDSGRWQLFDNEGTNMEYDDFDITVKEDDEYYYIDFNEGLGKAAYYKGDWTLEKAIEDQANIYKENC